MKYTINLTVTIESEVVERHTLPNGDRAWTDEYQLKTVCTACPDEALVADIAKLSRSNEPMAHDLATGLARWPAFLMSNYSKDMLKAHVGRAISSVLDTGLHTDESGS